MSMNLISMLLYNRAPLENISIDFKEMGINVLSAVNGKGKTTIISHIVDAFYEMARVPYPGSFEGRETKYYRLSSTLYQIDGAKPSLVYIRFSLDGIMIDYLDYRGSLCSRIEYEKIVVLANKIPFNELANNLGENNCVKFFSRNFSEKMKKKSFAKNILTYFPAYRYERPAYLNSPYKNEAEINDSIRFSNELPNPIENLSCLKDFTNWIMNVVLDMILYPHHSKVQVAEGKSVEIPDSPEIILWNHLNIILSKVLSSKNYEGRIRFGIGRRSDAGKRVSIMQETLTSVGGNMVCPNISLLSSGELALLELFGEILRQGDRLNPQAKLSDLSGIVLIDEVELHLHIRLQKEILPILFNIFPNIQFIVSSHSPFMNMGLADKSLPRTQVIDLDSNGIVSSPRNNDLYNEVYNMMVGENQHFAELYNNLKASIDKDTKPLIITEGKTDAKHIRAAMKHLNASLDVDFYEIGKQQWGDSQLKDMLDQLAKIHHPRKIIGIFDRDDENDTYVKYTENGDFPYKEVGINGGNVFAFCIPLVNSDVYGQKISIEHYYDKKDLLKEDSNGRRIFLGEEFYISGNSKDGNYQTRIKNIRHKVDYDGVIDEKVFDRNTDLEMKNSIALSKDDFADLMENDAEFSRGVNFSHFKEILKVIQSIIEL